MSKCLFYRIFIHRSGGRQKACDSLADAVSRRGSDSVRTLSPPFASPAARFVRRRRLLCTRCGACAANLLLCRY
uniref:Uncharacterized protein n=1 Tax=Globodera rostochiensis TaxID=31243 RepID=A0A914I3H1_GLORO